MTEVGENTPERWCCANSGAGDEVAGQRQVEITLETDIEGVVFHFWLRQGIELLQDRVTVVPQTRQADTPPVGVDPGEAGNPIVDSGTG